MLLPLMIILAMTGVPGPVLELPSSSSRSSSSSTASDPTPFTLHPTPSTKMVGMYIHQHWPYNHPYCARTWTVQEWRGYVGGLKKIGYNTILIWPMLETMPDPLTPSDK